jgi:hypothetical protein
MGLLMLAKASAAGLDSGTDDEAHFSSSSGFSSLMMTKVAGMQLGQTGLVSSIQERQQR